MKEGSLSAQAAAPCCVSLAGFCLLVTRVDLPGRPHPNPTNKYIKNITTSTSNTISLTFFHHILLRNPRLLTRKSRAVSPSLPVLSTNKSSLSPRSNTRSIFSVIISLTPSISRCAVLSASPFPLSVPPNSTINLFISPLKLAHP